jgi:hypothetical protein
MENLKKLVGKRIQSVRYMTSEEAQANYWHSRPIVIFFEDGSYMIPQSDDEGNDGGAVTIVEKSGVELIIGTL